jgi:hypothetical protein
MSLGGLLIIFYEVLLLLIPAPPPFDEDSLFLEAESPLAGLPKPIALMKLDMIEAPVLDCFP